MKTPSIAISYKTFQANCEPWLKIIRYNESGLVINFVGDHFYTIPQLLSDKNLTRNVLGKYYNRYILLYAELSSSTSLEDLRQQLVQVATARRISFHANDTFEQIVETLIKEGYEIAYFISRVEKLFIEKSDLLSKLEFIARNHRISFLYFSELNLSNPMFYEQQREYSSMFQNILYQEIYNLFDAEQFVTYNENLWEITLPSKLKSEIIKTCGGNLWLLRQAVRLFRNNPKSPVEQILNAPELLTKALASWSQLFPNEQKVIKELIFENKQNVSDVAALDYLFKIKLLIKDGLIYKLNIPLLEKVFQKDIKKEGFFIERGNTFYANHNLSNVLTYKEEQLLRFFMKHNKTLVKREKICDEVWNSEDVTDWALEKTVSKLRKKLISIGLPREILATKKGVGYVFHA